MQKDMLVIFMGQISQLLEVWKNKLLELVRSDQQVKLGSEVIAKEKCVNIVPALLEKALCSFKVVIYAPFCDFMHYVRDSKHLDEVFLHAKHISNMVKKRRPQTAGPVNHPRLCQFFDVICKIKIFRFWPGV